MEFSSSHETYQVLNTHWYEIEIHYENKDHYLIKDKSVLFWQRHSHELCTEIQVTVSIIKQEGFEPIFLLKALIAKIIIIPGQDVHAEGFGQKSRPTLEKMFH